MTDGFELEAVSVRHDDVDVLLDVTVTIPDDGITVVAGPSGSGKSSLLRLLNRLDDPTAGNVRWRGSDIGSLDPRELRRRVAMVFQRPVMFTGTVLDNLRTVAPDLDCAAAVERLESVAFDPALLQRDADRLSGGEAQRLCLARALTTAPDVVLADEPTASLDTDAQAHLEDLAQTMSRSVGWVWVTHDADQIERLADHVVIVDEGQVTASGTFDELTAHPDPRVRHVVLGERS